MKQVDPLLFAALYGVNRWDSAGVLRFWLRKGAVVVLDRYVEANFGHQASRVGGEGARERVVGSLGTFEHGWLGLPVSQLVLYLDLPPEVALRAMREDGARRGLDMHESAGVAYKERVRQTFLWCAQRDPKKWVVIPSLEEKGEVTEGTGMPVRRSRECVHAQCMEVVEALLKRK